MLVSLPRYGPTWDVLYEFPRATAYVSHALGETPPSNISPWHQLSYERAQSEHGGSVNGCLPSLIAAATGKLFYEKLGVLDYIDAYHLGLALLWLLFVIHFHSRLAELHGPRLALIATVLLALAPRIVAHVPNNMKDLPALAFGTAALLELAVGLTHGRPRRIYLTALFVGCAVSSKFVAGVIAVPGAVLVFLALRGGGLVAHLRPAYWLPLASIPVVTVAVFIGHWPYLWEPPAEIWARLGELAEIIARRTGGSPSLYPFVMAAITSPLLMLAGLASALAATFCKPAETRVDRTLLLFYTVWLLGVLAIFSSGRVALFDGVRHFLLFLPPSAILAAWGLLRASDGLCERISERGWNVRWARTSIAPLVVLVSLVPLARYHPYEVTYFNSLVGGLPGATELRFRAVRGFEPRDYWGTSVRASFEWANQHLPKGAALTVSRPRRFDRVFRRRPDLTQANPNSPAAWPYYLIFAQRKGWLGEHEQAALRHGELVHQEEIQGVPLSFVYRITELDDPPLFEDGFETGDTSRWSTSSTPVREP